MRIDRGPTLEEIRSSVENGRIVSFRCMSGEEVRGNVLDAKLDHAIGRVALVMEQQNTGLIWFARYRYGSVRWQCGDLSTWNLRRGDIEEVSHERRRRMVPCQCGAE